MNAISILGGLVALAGLLLFTRYLFGTFGALIKRARFRRSTRAARKSQGVYAGAMSARDVYVPWTVAKRFVGILFGLLVTALGAAIGGTGLMLARDYIHLDPDPSPVGTLQVSAPRAGELQINYEERDETWSCANMLGNYVVVRGEYIFFDERLARVGLTAYQRLITIESYLRKADVLINQPQALCDIHRSSQLWQPLERLQQHQDWVTIRRHVSRPLSVDPRPQELLAGHDGYHVPTLEE